MGFKEYAKVYSIVQYWGPKDKQQQFPVYMDLRKLDNYPNTIDEESEYGESMISEFYEKIMKYQYSPHPYRTPPGKVHRSLLTIRNGGHTIYFKDKEKESSKLLFKLFMGEFKKNLSLEIWVKYQKFR